MKTTEKTSFIFYPSFKESLMCLDDKERLIMYDALTEYGLNGTEPTFENKALQFGWIQIKLDIDAAKAKYDKKKLAGSAGGKAKAEKINSKPLDVKIEELHQPEEKVSIIEEKAIETSINQSISDDEIIFGIGIELKIEDYFEEKNLPKEFLKDVIKKFDINEKYRLSVLLARVDGIVNNLIKYEKQK